MPRTARTPSQDPEIRLLSALADPTRLAIVRELAASNETCACDFTATCDVGQPTVSHHLKVLRDTGWVDTERRGTWIYYRLRPDAAARFRQLAGDLIPSTAASATSFGAARRIPVLQPQA